MMYRKAEKLIEAHLQSNSKRVLVVEGARQIGKSYTIRTVGQRMFPNYIEINMEEDKLNEQIFANAKSVKDFYVALSVVAGDRMKEKENTLVFIDEIQVYDHLLTLIKFLKQDDRFTYIASGSQLGIALKNTSSIPIGSISIEQMYPMDFEEFLIANGIGEMAIDSMRTAFDEGKPLSDALHNKMMDLFRKYLITGGLPAVVEQFVETHNIAEVRKMQQEIHTLYAADASRYESENSQKLQIKRIFDSVPSVLENKKKRIVAKDIEGKDWKRMADYQNEFEFLISSGITLDVKAISNPKFPLSESLSKNLLKLYLNDVGMLSGIYYNKNIQAILNDECNVNLGTVYETVVAQELKAHGFKLFYYDNKKNGEVDFIIDDMENLSVMPIEVKSGKDYTIHSALNKFITSEEYNIKHAYVLSNDGKVHVKNGITYIPVYYVMFF
ncbi:MAG: ATP-binding protein, partial [Bacteroidales bacterium]|nr:ATP-binding protein [Bacteroidales bacterium]